MNFTFERYQWIPTPDGKLILVDTWSSKVVENAPIYETSTSNTIDTEKEEQIHEEPKVRFL